MSLKSEQQAQPLVDGQWIRVAALTALQAKGRLTVSVQHNVIALFEYDGRVYAVDNRCPHMGFPLDKGTVNDCILTCHWHHARFDLSSGGTFDEWADDVCAFPVRVRDGEILIDVAPSTDQHQRSLARLRDGLERDI